jgi:hypothetical protein
MFITAVSSPKLSITPLFSFVADRDGAVFKLRLPLIGVTVLGDAGTDVGTGGGVFTAVFTLTTDPVTYIVPPGLITGSTGTGNGVFVAEGGGLITSSPFFIVGSFTEIIFKQFPIFTKTFSLYIYS